MQLWAVLTKLNELSKIKDVFVKGQLRENMGGVEKGNWEYRYNCMPVYTYMEVSKMRKTYKKQ